MLYLDPVLGWDFLGVLVGLGTIVGAWAVAPGYRRVGRIVLGAGFLAHRGYWLCWRWLGEAGLLESKAAFSAHTITPALATGAMVVGLLLCALSPLIARGLVRHHHVALIGAGAVVVWWVGVLSPQLGRWWLSS